MGTLGALCKEAHQTLQVGLYICLIETSSFNQVSETVQECVCLHWASLLATHGGGREDVCKIPGLSNIDTFVIVKLFIRSYY